MSVSATREVVLPELREYDLRASDDAPPRPVRARRLADISTRRHDHTHDTAREPVPTRGWRCSACRWIEIEIFLVPHPAGDGDADDRYVVRQVGRSLVAGEVDRVTVGETTSPYEVIELLTVRRSPAAATRDRPARPGGPYLPGPSARALAQAANYDDALLDAFENRRVA